MTKAIRTVGVAIALLALGGTVRADEWDEGSDDDGGAGTDNVIVHGVEQIHDLHSDAGVPDQDWYLVTARPFSSYQMVLDGFTGDTNLTTQRVQRLNATGGVVLQDALATDGGGVLSLDWLQGAGPLVTLVRVQNGCPSCDYSSTYRIRFYDTTFLVPRFNNSGTQATVLLVQNAIDHACTVTYHYFSAAGTLIASSGPSTLAARALQVLATAPVTGATSGSVRVSHTCGYGGLSGKAVSVEPSTGFTFDTAMVARPD